MDPFRQLRTLCCRLSIDAMFNRIRENVGRSFKGKTINVRAYYRIWPQLNFLRVL